MSMTAPGVRAGVEFKSILTEPFRKAGWRVSRSSSVTGSAVELILEGREQRYVVQLKVSSEGRPDRLIPLLSQAILEVQDAAQRIPSHVIPLAVVAAKRIPPSVSERLKQFAARHAPNVAVGVMDAEGFRSFVGPGLDGLDAMPTRRTTGSVVSTQRLPDLFSDLNQWMLKILLGQHIPEALIRYPGSRFGTLLSLPRPRMFPS